MNIWFTSDTHYNHKNICRGTSQWNLDEEQGSNHQKTRDFNTLEEMNTTIVNEINKYVKPNDILYHLGDWSFGGIESIWEFRKQINCQNIHLVLGNHDHHIENNRVLPNCYYDSLGYIVDNTTGHKGTTPVHARALFSSVNHIINDKIDNQKMILCHYAMRTWDKAHHGSWMLFGHSHGTLGEYQYIGPSMKSGNLVTCDLVTKSYKTIDVGIDNIYNIYKEYRPISLHELKHLMNNRPSLEVDHHNKNTN